MVKLNYNKIDDAGDITFVCSSEGLPVTFTTWKKDSFNASQYDDVDQVNVLVHPLSSSYNSELTIHNTNLTSLQDCTLMCDIYTEWVMSDQSEYGRQRKLNYHKGLFICHLETLLLTNCWHLHWCTW